MGAPTAEAVGRRGGRRACPRLIVQVALAAGARCRFVDIDVDAGELRTAARPSAAGRDRVCRRPRRRSIAVVLTVPALRARRSLPAMRPAVANLWRRGAEPGASALELFGGNLVSRSSATRCASARSASRTAFTSTSPSCCWVNLMASVLSSCLGRGAGGVGAEEAALTAGLVAVGVDESTAFAIALTHRFCTSYLPPIWGSVALRWLGREEERGGLHPSVAYDESGHRAGVERLHNSTGRTACSVGLSRRI